MSVRVQSADFDIAAEIDALRSGNHAIGAIVTFTGTVRDPGGLSNLTLEHYPGMTEAALERIEAEAKSRWSLEASLIIHRHGPLAPGDNIVLVVTASRHRQAAFEAAAFMMDYLKTEAPFWKREDGPDGHRWVDAAEDDDAARRRWQR